MMRILFLAKEMRLGFGVSVVVEALTVGLRKRGVEVQVGCQHSDHYFRDMLGVRLVEAETAAVDELISETRATHVVAHTTPYFELLPKLGVRCERWVWEHGEPDPELFPADCEERRRIIQRKQRLVYPAVDYVIAISEFVKAAIQWPDAIVIPNGSEHINPSPPHCRMDGAFKVGALMRLGAGERFYKGGDLLIRLQERLRPRGRFVLSVMGRGASEDAAVFSGSGIDVQLNATNEERADYLKDLDVFISLSLWEGFNLPLVEAQMSGTMSVAFDVGAHPEVTPFLVSNLGELENFLVDLERNRGLVMDYARAGQVHCREQFSWERACDRVTASMGKAAGASNRRARSGSAV